MTTASPVTTTTSFLVADPSGSASFHFGEFQQALAKKGEMKAVDYEMTGGDVLASVRVLTLVPVNVDGVTLPGGRVITLDAYTMPGEREGTKEYLVCIP